MAQWIVRFGTLIAFSMVDGSIEFRFRDSMELASADGNYEEVSTLSQYGFGFPHREPALHITLSPNHCCAITMDSEGKVRLRRMESGEDLATLKEDQPQFGALCALVATCITSSILGYTAFDDLLAILPRNLGLSLSASISEQLFVACAPIGGKVDYTQAPQPELNIFMTKSSTARHILSFNNAILPLNKGRRSTGAKVSFTILNIRILWFHLSRGMQDENNWRPETAASLAGNTKYVWALLCFIINELGNIANVLGDSIKNRQALEAHILTTGTPAIHLVLCSLSRRLLRSLCSVLYKQYQFTNKKLAMLRTQAGANASEQQQQQPNIITSQMRQWQQFFTIYKQCPIVRLVLQDRSPLDTWLAQLDQVVNQCYASSAGPGSAGTGNREDRQRTEASMLTRATIPEHLMPAIHVLFDTLPKLQEHYDPGVLYRYDTSWLDLAPDAVYDAHGKLHTHAANSSRRRKLPIDVLKKSEVLSCMPTKFCARCGSVSQEYDGGGSSSGSAISGGTERIGPAPPFWLQGSLRSCICAAMWALTS